MTDQPSAIQLAKSIRLFGLNAFSASMSVRGAEKKLNERMWEPKIGDLVFEMTTANRCKDDNEHLNAVGYLLSKGEETDGDGNTDDVHVILTLDGREMRWTNAQFLALPHERIRQFDRLKAPDGVGSEPSRSATR